MLNNQISHHVLTLDRAETARDSRQLLAVSEQKRSGLILCKAHHAEFAGPGAAVGTLVEEACTQIIAIGAPDIIPVTTYKKRQNAYSRRIQWVRWLQKITEHPEAIQRAEKLFSSFEAFFGAQVLLGLSDEVLALLVGVLPTTIATVRSQYHQPEHTHELDSTAPHSLTTFSTIAVNPRLPSAFPPTHPAVSISAANLFESLYNRP